MASPFSTAVELEHTRRPNLTLLPGQEPVLWSRVVLIALLVLALSTRICSAMKYFFTDERFVFANTFTFAFKATLIPDNTFYPSFYALLAAPLTWLWSKLLVAFGVIPSFEELPFLLAMHSPIPLAPARVLSVVAGATTVYVAYRLGKEVFGEWPGLLGASFLSLSVLHVHQSGYALPDILTSLFATCAALFAIKALSSGTLRHYIYAGLFVGLTATTKYNGALIVLCIIFVHVIQLGREGKLFRPWVWVDMRVLGSAAAAVFAFLAGTPGLVLDHQAYLKTFHKMQGKVMGQSSGLPFDFFSPEIYEVLSYWDSVLVVLGAMGICYALVRGGAARWVLSGALLVSLSHMSTWVIKSPQYFLFLTPLYSVLAGAMLFDFSKKASSLVHSTRLQVGFQVGIVALVLALPASHLFDYTMVRLKKDNREIALNWFHSRVPAGARLVVDWHIYQPKFMSETEYFALLGTGDIEFRAAYLAPYKHYEGIAIQYNHTWLANVEADYLITTSPIYTRYMKRGRSRGRFYSDLFSRPEEFGWRKVREFANGGEVGVVVFKRMKKWKRELSM